MPDRGAADHSMTIHGLRTLDADDDVGAAGIGI
jgi:hypothetical protein